MKPCRALLRSDFPAATGIVFSAGAGFVVWLVIALVVALAP